MLESNWQNRGSQSTSGSGWKQQPKGASIENILIFVVITNVIINIFIVVITNHEYLHFRIASSLIPISKDWSVAAQRWVLKVTFVCSFVCAEYGKKQGGIISQIGFAQKPDWRPDNNQISRSARVAYLGEIINITSRQYKSKKVFWAKNLQDNLLTILFIIKLLHKKNVIYILLQLFHKYFSCSPD